MSYQAQKKRISSHKVMSAYYHYIRLYILKYSVEEEKEKHKHKYNLEKKVRQKIVPEYSLAEEKYIKIYIF